MFHIQRSFIICIALGACKYFKNILKSLCAWKKKKFSRTCQLRRVTIFLPRQSCYDRPDKSFKRKYFKTKASQRVTKLSSSSKLHQRNSHSDFSFWVSAPPWRNSSTSVEHRLLFSRFPFIQKKTFWLVCVQKKNCCELTIHIPNDHLYIQGWSKWVCQHFVTLITVSKQSFIINAIMNFSCAKVHKAVITSHKAHLDDSISLFKSKRLCEKHLKKCLFFLSGQKVMEDGSAGKRKFTPLCLTLFVII